MRTKTTYDKITLLAEKSGRCACGKRRRRTKTFWGTSNPFNGWKDPEEIRAGLRVKISEWMEEPITCEECC